METRSSPSQGLGHAQGPGGEAPRKAELGRHPSTCSKAPEPQDRGDCPREAHPPSMLLSRHLVMWTGGQRLDLSTLELVRQTRPRPSASELLIPRAFVVPANKPSPQPQIQMRKGTTSSMGHRVRV